MLEKHNSSTQGFTRSSMKALGLFIFLIYLYCPLLLANVTAPTKSFTIPNSQVHTIHSSKLNRTYELYIKTPPGYEKNENAKRTYPVVYMNDGPTAFQVASGVIRPGTFSGSLQPTILVGISYAVGEKGMNSRIRDYTPTEAETWKPYVTGGGPEYLSFIENDVIPFVETHYRADATNRTLTGHSVGGLFGIYTLITKPNLFSNYILTSPTLWFEDDLMYKLTEKFLSKHKNLTARIYIASGSLETAKNEKGNTIHDLKNKFISLFNVKNHPNLKIRNESIDGAIHDTVFPAAFAKGALWIFGQKNKDETQTH